MKTMKLYMAAACAIMLAGCDIKDTIYDSVPQQQGKIILTTDWSQIDPELTAPTDYKVVAGSYSATLSGTENTLDHLFEPGDYSLFVYNEPDNITLSGSIATADYDGELGWFFSSAQDVAIEKGKEHKFTAEMLQQVRQLTLVIEFEGDVDAVESIDVELSGVAGSYDIVTGVHGAETTVPLTFEKDDTDGKWKATVRLLGVTGDEQRLMGMITFTDGTPADISLDSDLTTALAAFNDDKKTPLTLAGAAVEIPAEGDTTGTIDDWTEVPGGEVILYPV